MAKKMYNEFMLCKLIKGTEQGSGFQTEVDKGFKEVEITFSKDEEIVKGDVSLIKGNIGEPLNLKGEEFLVIHKTDIIMTL